MGGGKSGGSMGKVGWYPKPGGQGGVGGGGRWPERRGMGKAGF